MPLYKQYCEFIKKLYGDEPDREIFISRCVSLAQFMIEPLFENLYMPFELRDGKKIGSVAIRLTDYDRLEDLVDEIVYLHRRILLYMYLKSMSDGDASPLNDVVNVSEEDFLSFEVKWRSDAKFANYFVCDDPVEERSRRFLYVSDILLNESRFSKEFCAIFYRPVEGRTVALRGEMVYTLVYNGYSHDLRIKNDQLNLYGLSSVRMGWNVFSIIRGPWPIYNTRLPKRSPAMIELRTGVDLVSDDKKIYDNKSYSNQLWVANWSYSNEYVPSNTNLNFLNIINRINSFKFKVSDDALKFIEMAHAGGSGAEQDFVVGSNKETIAINKQLRGDLMDMRGKSFYPSFVFDRRGRMHCREYPMNYQQNKLARYSLVVDRDLKVTVPEVSSYLSSLNKEELDTMLDEEIPEELKSLLPIEKLSDRLSDRYVYKIYDIIFIKIISTFDKITPNVSDSSLMHKHIDALKDMICESEIENIIKKHKLYVDPDLIMELWTLFKSLKDMLSGVIPDYIVLLDAAGSVFQMHAIINHIDDEELLGMLGLLPYSGDSRGVYEYLLELVKNEWSKDESKSAWVKLLNRKLIKSVSMPRLYGLTYVGMVRRLKAEIPDISKIITNDDDISDFYSKLWRQIGDGLSNIGMDAKYNVALLALIHDKCDFFGYVNKIGLPIFLNKNMKKKLPRERVKKTICRKIDGAWVRCVNRKDVANYVHVADKRSTKQGLYVGLVHQADASIQHRLIEQWNFSSALVTIHDSNGCSIELLPIMSYLFKKSMVDWSKYYIENNYITNTIKSNEKLSEDKVMIEYMSVLGVRKKNIIENGIYDKIIKSKRLFF